MAKKVRNIGPASVAAAFTYAENVQPNQVIWLSDADADTALAATYKNAAGSVLNQFQLVADGVEHNYDVRAYFTQNLHTPLLLDAQAKEGAAGLLAASMDGTKVIAPNGEEIPLGGSGDLTVVSNEVRQGSTPMFYIPSGLGAFEKVMSANGVVGNGNGNGGGTDDRDALQAALNAFTVAGKHRRAILPDLSSSTGPGFAYKIGGAGLKFNCNALSFDGNGARLDCSSMTSGTAITLASAAGTHFDYSGPIYFQRVSIKLADTDAGAVDGIYMYDVQSVGRVMLDGVEVIGARDGLVIGSNVYINQFRGLQLMSCHRYGINVTATTNAGESLNFFGGLIGECNNASGTAVGIYLPSTAPGMDMMFYGTSFSYNDIAFDQYGGQLMLVNGHIENAKSTAPMGYLSTVGGKPATTFIMNGGQIIHGGLPGGVGTESSSGRQHMIVIRPNTADRLYAALKGVAYNGFDRKNTELIHYVGPGLVGIDIDYCQFTPNGNPPKVCRSTNLLYNGDFAANATAGMSTRVSSVAIGAGGTGYSATPSVAFSGGTLIAGGRPASGTVTVNGSNVVTGVTLTYGGDYVPGTTAPTVTITDATGTGATATATMDGGATITQDTAVNTDNAGDDSYVSAIAVGGAGGSGYSAQTVVTVSGGGQIGAPATAVPTIAGGIITGITVTYGGSYTPGGATPTVTITDPGGGSGATGTATLTNPKRSLKVVGTGGTTVRSWTVPVRSGKKLQVRGFYWITAWTAGGINITVDWLDNAGAVISTTNVGNSPLSSVQATPQLRGNQYRVPRGCASARINLNANTFTGTAFFGDVSAHMA